VFDSLARGIFMLGLLPTENWEYKFSDIIRGLAAGLRPREINEMLFIPGLGSCIPARSARAGLSAAIKALNLPAGARIGVPLYCCPVVFKAIKVAGCTPCFIDINHTTFCMSAEDLFTKRSQVDAIIAVHMFGNMCDMPRLQEAAQGKPIIEDCAQSLGSKLDGRMAGSFGTIAAFSFRSGKYLSVGEGGALFSNHADIRSRLSQLTAEMPTPGRAEESVHVAVTYIRSMLRSKPLYGVVGYPLWAIYNKKVDYSAKSPIVMSQIYRADLAITKKRLAFLDPAIEAQRANADFYSSTLNLDLSMLCSEKPGTFYNRYLYPITFPSSEHRELMAAYLHNHQIGTMQPYKDIAEVAATHYGYSDDCPVAEQVAKRVLIIPSYYSLKKGEVQRIANCLNAGWAEITKSGVSKKAKRL
jgi:perosamine synthetase